MVQTSLRFSGVAPPPDSNWAVVLCSFPSHPPLAIITALLLVAPGAITGYKFMTVLSVFSFVYMCKCFCLFVCGNVLLCSVYPAVVSGGTAGWLSWLAVRIRFAVLKVNH